MQIDDLRRVLVVGAGRMGTEVALQCAVAGYDVILQDLSAEQFAKSAEWQQWYFDGFLHEGMLTPDDVAAVRGRITTTTDLSSAASVDFVSESIPENLKLKRDLFGRLHSLCPPHAVFTTNTSYLRPSQIAGHAGRPAQFAALHFHPPVWKSNVVDIMPHEGTNPEVVELLRQFSGRIGQIPIVCRHQGEGYIFNTMLRTWLLTAITLADSGIGTFEDVDRSWMGVMRHRVGPFGILDNIGLDTVCDILHFWGMILRDQNAKKASAFLKPYVEAGRLGIKTMRGFYDYPDAAYLREDFLTSSIHAEIAGNPLMRRFVEAGQRGSAGYAAQVEAAGFRLPGMEGAGSTSSPVSKKEGVTRPAPTSLPPLSADAPQRYVLRALPTPIHQKIRHVLQFHGKCLIVGENPTAEALRAKLASLGGDVATLPLEGSLEDVLARHDELWTQQSYPHLFLTTARDAGAATQLEEAWWANRTERGLHLPFFVAQKWYAEVMKRGLFETATIVAATALGGDYGASGRIDAVEGGGIAGLLKTIYLEGAVRSSLGPQVKIVDSPLDQDSTTTAEQICRELALAQASVVTGSRDESRRRYVETEVGYVRGVRHQMYVERSPLPAPARTTDSADCPIPPGSTWVVTGGARGITEFVARALATRFHLRMHLLGTTSLPDRDFSGAAADELAALEAATREQAARAGRDGDAAWQRIRRGIDVQRTLAEWGAAGLQVSYHSCDVTDRAQLAATLNEVRGQDGPIAGILHGAGLEVGAKLPEKNPDVVRATIAVKAAGMSHLMDLTRDDPLQWFLAFGSLSGRFGNFAQADYAMANELLAKQLVWFRGQRPDCRSIVFHWPGWTDVGMAARPDGEQGLKRGHHTFLAPNDGLNHLFAEIAQETPAAEVVIVHRNEAPLEMRIEPAVGGKRAPTWQR